MGARWQWHGIVAAVVTLMAAAPVTDARAEPLAVTIDDLPLLSLRDDPHEALTVTRRLTRGLKRCRIPATGFVVGEKFEQLPRLRAQLLETWRHAGLELGNHTYSHLSLNAVTPDAYVADIARDDALLSALGGSGKGKVRWFRHPYLETGGTEDARTHVGSWLMAHGYRVAPVTLENDDDVFAAPYEDAVRRKDRSAAASLRASYLALTGARITWYREAAGALLGRRPAFVLLIHATLLNADVMPQLCRLVRQEGLQPVGLDEALQDPAYGLPDGPPDRDGDDWLNRWAVVLGKDLPWDSFPEAPQDIRAAAARLDPDTH